MLSRITNYLVVISLSDALVLWFQCTLLGLYSCLLTPGPPRLNTVGSDQTQLQSGNVTSSFESTQDVLYK